MRRRGFLGSLAALVLAARLEPEAGEVWPEDLGEPDDPLALTFNPGEPIGRATFDLETDTFKVALFTSGNL